MAKNQDVSFVEQHVEKIVLGVSILLLCLVVVHWGIASPLTVEVIGETGAGKGEVAPDNADETILKAARVIEKKNLGAKPTEPPAPEFASKLAAAASTPFPADMNSCVDLGIVAKVIDTGIAPRKDANDQLTLDLLAAKIPAPSKPVVRSDFELPRPGVGEEPKDIVAVHGVAVFPYGQLVRNWRELLASWATPQLGVLRVEVESQSAVVRGEFTGEPRVVRVFRIPPMDNEGHVKAIPAIPAYNTKNGGEVTKAAMDLQQMDWQSYFLTPPYPDVYSSGQWSNWQNLLPQVDLSKPVETEGPSSSTTPAVAAKTEAPAGQQGAIPDLIRQIEGGRVLLAFHDRSVKAGIYYRYRVRVVMINPLLTNERPLRDANEAAVVEVASKNWSAWSDPVISFNPTEFFLTGASNDGSSLRATIFTRALGTTVMMDIPSVEPGKSIGGMGEVVLPNPMTGASLSRKVDFSTGTVVVEVDMNRAYTNAAGMTSTNPTLLLLNKAGELQTRTLKEDEGNPRPRELKAQKPIPAKPVVSTGEAK